MKEPTTKQQKGEGWVSELDLIYEISKTLDSGMDLKKVLGPVLEKMATHMGMVHGAITLLERQTGDIFIDTAYGLSDSQKKRGRYKLGEGVTGKVVQTGKPVVVSRISEEPQFLDRTGARGSFADKDVSFICVPIKLEKEVIGALSFDRPYSERAPLDDEVRILSIISSMIAQAVHLRRSAQEERQRLLDENIRLKEELKDRFRPDNIIGNSRVMQEVYDLIMQVSKSNATVLIKGESGTGKELVAHAIHFHSHRAANSFIKVNCAALPATVIESELFGHEKGAFTGALKTKKGRFELAHGGTLFLDEVGDLSQETQIKLLRVLQEREFERVGGTETIKVNVRILAATNRNLEELIEKGVFREDLYFRLNVFPIHIPPLRERKADILLLADHFAEKYGQQNNKEIKRISTPAIDMLMSYHWPGNVRELENIVERAVILSNDNVVHGHHLPPTLQTAEATGTPVKVTLHDALDSLEREMILDALKSSRGNRASAARQLGISERLMGIRVSKHGIEPRRFRTKR